MVFCSICGQENSDENEYCSECESLLFKEEYRKINHFNGFEDIFTAEYLNSLKNPGFSEDDYQIILDNIRDMGQYRLDEIIQSGEYRLDSPLSKVMAITMAYAPINYKSRGAELGSYGFNMINVDDRLDSSNQIATLIHELTHHLVSEIFEQVLMYVWDVEKNDYLEAFVFFSLTSNPVALLMNEYCAHSVEGRFVPHGYQNYGSFNNVLVEKFDIKKDMDTVVYCSIYGNTIADDLLGVFEHFIGFDLRQDIKTQFKYDYVEAPRYDQILFERKELMDRESLINSIFKTLLVAFEFARREDAKGILNLFEENYRKFNQMQNTSQ